MTSNRSRRERPIGTGERMVIGAVVGVAVCFVLSGLLVQGISSLRTTACAAGAVIGAAIYVARPGIAWLGVGATLAAWCIVAFTPVSRSVAIGLVRRDTIPRRVSAVVVLSGSVTDDGMLGPEALDRLLTAIALLRSGTSSMLVITQPHPLGDPAITTAADQRRIIALLPGDGPTVIVIDSVVSTRTEALGAAKLLPPPTAQTIALVTSPLHTRRACAVFEHVGYRVVCVPSESRDIALHTLTSANERLAAFRMAVSERLAIALYRHRGWI